MKKRGKIILGILAALIVVAGGAFYTWAQQPSSRLLLSSIYFMEVTLKNPGYLLHDIDNVRRNVIKTHELLSRMEDKNENN